MRKHGVRVETIRAADHDIATGVWPDMTEHGAATDAWPSLYAKVLDADILVIAGPIWLGDNSSVTKRVIERLYACSHLLNDAGQYATFMTWNLLHLARMLKDAGGIPAHGNQRSGWDAGCRYDFDNPDYR